MINLPLYNNMPATTHHLSFRTATIADKAALKAIGIAAYSQYANVLAPEHWATMQANLEADAGIEQLLTRATGFLCECDGQLAGVIYLLPHGNPTAYFQDDWAYIRMLGVLPQYRGRGIGRALTMQCIAHAKAMGEHTIALHTSEFQDAARGMYEGIGFTVAKEIGPLYDKRYWVYTMQL